MPAASKPVCRLLAAQKLTDRALDIQLRLQSGETVFQHAATESHDPWADLFSLIETLAEVLQLVLLAQAGIRPAKTPDRSRCAPTLQQHRNRPKNHTIKPLHQKRNDKRPTECGIATAFLIIIAGSQDSSVHLLCRPQTQGRLGVRIPLDRFEAENVYHVSQRPFSALSLLLNPTGQPESTPKYTLATPIYT